MDQKLFPRLLAEAIATFMLVFIGAGSVLANDLSAGSLGMVGIALAHGLVLMAMVYAIAPISGGHINPAVTIALWANRKMETMTAGFYVVAQLIGAGIAGFCLREVFPKISENLHYGVPTLLPGISPTVGFGVEAILTFLLVFVIFAVAVDSTVSPAVSGLAIGLTLAVGILFGGILTGGALNPARAFGPALAAGYWVNHWLYWLGPILGALVAGFVWQKILRRETSY